jgi:hypothetical protein
MLKRLIILAAILSAFQAVAQTSEYVIYPSLAACQARSQSQCASLSCDGTYTRFWWSCTGPLQPGLVGPNAVTNQSYALTIQPGTPFDTTTNNLVSNGTVGLNATEVNKIEPASAMANVLPSANGANAVNEALP